MGWLRNIAILAIGLTAGMLLGRYGLMGSGAMKSQPGMRLNHFGVSARNLDESMDFYTRKLGFPVAYTVRDNEGKLTSYHLRIGRDTELELQAMNAERPPGITHVGLWVDDIDSTVAALRKQGVEVGDPFTGFTKAHVTNIVDPNGVRLELLEFPPESMQRRSMEGARP
jgi:catechol 2,3-dioxygenase-like lactoylglutathione lyase family enzyme